MNLEELQQQLAEVSEHAQKVRENIIKTQEREDKRDKNRRTSRIRGAIIANAAIAQIMYEAYEDTEDTSTLVHRIEKIFDQHMLWFKSNPALERVRIVSQGSFESAD